MKEKTMFLFSALADQLELLGTAVEDSLAPVAKNCPDDGNPEARVWDEVYKNAELDPTTTAIADVVEFFFSPERSKILKELRRQLGKETAKKVDAEAAAEIAKKIYAAAEPATEAGVMQDANPEASPPKLNEVFGQMAGQMDDTTLKLLATCTLIETRSIVIRTSDIVSGVQGETLLEILSRLDKAVIELSRKLPSKSYTISQIEDVGGLCNEMAELLRRYRGSGKRKEFAGQEKAAFDHFESIFHEAWEEMSNAPTAH